MADEKRFVLVIESKGEQGGGNGGSSFEPAADVGSNTSQDGGSDYSKAYYAQMAMKIIGTTVSETVDWAMYFWDTQLELNDDYVGKREKRIAMQQVNRVVSAASNIGSSTLQGAMAGGAVGAIIGFVVSTGTEVYKTVKENIQGNRSQELQLAQLNAQLEFTRSRAGYSTQAASIGENL